MEIVEEISGYPIDVLKKLYRNRGKKINFDIMFSEQEHIDADDFDSYSLSKKGQYLDYLADLGLITGTRYNRNSAKIEITKFGEQFVQAFLHPRLKRFLFSHYLTFNDVDKIKCEQIKHFIKNNSLKPDSNSLKVVHTMSHTCNNILKDCLKNKKCTIKDCYNDLSDSDDDRNDEIRSLDDLNLINVTEHNDEISDNHYYVCSITPLGKFFLHKNPQILHAKEITASNLISFYQGVVQADLPDSVNDDSLPIDMSDVRFNIEDLCSYGHPYYHESFL